MDPWVNFRKKKHEMRNSISALGNENKNCESFRYVRIRVGHYIYETQTDPNGGKTPRWNRVFHTQLPAGVNKIFIEIYDECNFTMDELIAWTEVRIPDVVLERGETHEDW